MNSSWKLVADVGELIEEMKSYVHRLYEFVYYMNPFIIWMHMLDEFTDDISLE